MHAVVQNMNMTTEPEIALDASQIQEQAREYPLVTLRGYEEWSRQRLEDGVPERLIAHLDGRSMTLLPEQAARVTARDFDAMLADLTGWLKR